jgi:glycyl-tRNA synthetase beta subunit
VYWLREAKAVNAEVDFVAALGGEILPIEIKAGKSGSLRSLHQFVAQKKSRRALRFDANPPSTLRVQQVVVTAEGRKKKVDFELINLPLYLSSESFRILG